MKSLKKKIALSVALPATLLASTVSADVLFWSTQAKPVQEQQAMREQVLAGI